MKALNLFLEIVQFKKTKKLLRLWNNLLSDVTMKKNINI